MPSERTASDTQILINNAGVLAFASVIEGSIEGLQQDMHVNYFGTLNVTRAFAPVITQNGGGAIASISSIFGLASMVGIGGYSASKAALFSAIQASRAELKPKNIEVFGIFQDAISAQLGVLWMSNPKELERQFATM